MRSQPAFKRTILLPFFAPFVCQGQFLFILFYRLPVNNFFYLFFVSIPGCFRIAEVSGQTIVRFYTHRISMSTANFKKHHIFYNTDFSGSRQLRFLTQLRHITLPGPPRRCSCISTPAGLRLRNKGAECTRRFPKAGAGSLSPGNGPSTRGRRGSNIPHHPLILHP